MAFNLENADYQSCLAKYDVEYEKMCKRCGACCGTRDNDPCENLKKDHDGLFFCTQYSERLGVQKTISGKSFICVPIRNLLITRSAPHNCVYMHRQNQCETLKKEK